MDMSSGEWLSHLAMEDPSAMMKHCQMMMNSNNCYDPKTTSSSALTQINDDPEAIWEQLKADTNSGGWSSCAASCASGQLISFGSSDCNVNHVIKPNKEDKPLDFGDYGANYSTALIKANKNSHQKRVIGSSEGGRLCCSREHVLVERKRREKMAQRFHTLSALIPGLKKMDKASILGDAAKYLKQLEEQVKVLEKQTAKRIVESVVVANKIDEYGNSFSDENLNSSMNRLLEIEARTSEINVLIRIHSQKDQGLACRVLNEIQKLHLTTLNCNTVSFGGYATDVTIVAKMEEDFCLAMKDLVMHLRMILHDIEKYFHTMISL